MAGSDNADEKFTYMPMTHGRSLIPAVLIAALASSAFIVPWWFFVGMGHFGFVSGPNPTIGLWVSYMLWSLGPTALGFAAVLRHNVSKRTRRRLTLRRAVVVAVVSLVPIQAAMGMITLYQWRDGHYDGEMFVGAVVAGLSMAIFMTRLLSVRVDQPVV